LSKIKLIFVDDNQELTDLFKLILSAEEDFECLRSLNSTEQLIECVANDTPDIVVMDLSMPEPAPLDVVELVCSLSPGTRVIFYSARDDEASQDAAYEAGAWGFVSKNIDCSELIKAIRKVANGETFFSVSS